MNCTCGHDEIAHEHYRPTSACAIRGCDCSSFTVPWRDRLPAWLRRWISG